MNTFTIPNIINDLSADRQPGLPPLYTKGGPAGDGVKPLGNRGNLFAEFWCLPTNKGEDGKPIPSSMQTVLGVKHLAYAKGLVVDSGRLKIETVNAVDADGVIRPCVSFPVSVTTIQVELDPSEEQIKMGAVKVHGSSESAKIMRRTNGRAVGSLKPADEKGKQYAHSFVVHVIVPVEQARKLDLAARRQIQITDCHDVPGAPGYVSGSWIQIENIDSILDKNKGEVATPEKGMKIGSEVGNEGVKSFAEPEFVPAKQ